MAVYLLNFQQYLPASPEKVWQFISAPANLKKITPPYMGFDMINPPDLEGMYAGMILCYRVKPVPGIPVKWITEITHVEEGSYFVDEQRIGPYRLWHHEHHLEPSGGGVLMTDRITYAPPLGFLGAVTNRIFIRKQLYGIFSFRSRTLKTLFPPKE